MREPFLSLPGADLRRNHLPTGCIEGFEPPQGYPKCCKSHEEILNRVLDWWKRFPDCCDPHRELSKKSWFKKEDYKHAPDKIMTSLACVEYFISVKINDDDWYKEIIDYLEYLEWTFGQPAVGVGKYKVYMAHFVKTTKPTEWDFPENKRIKLLKYINRKPKPISEEDLENQDLNLLFSVFQKWLTTVPDIHHFSQLKERLSDKVPMNLFIYDMEYNKYTGMSKCKVKSQFQVVEELLNLTKEIISQIDTHNIVQNQEVIQSLRDSIHRKSEAHRVKQLKLSTDYNSKEKPYLKIIEKWLKNEVAFFKDILPDLQSLPQPSLPEAQLDNSFTYVNFTTNQESLKDLFDRLKSISSFEANYKLTSFKKLFSGNKIDSPTVWTGTKGDLCTLIRELKKQNKIKSVDIYNICANLFVDKGGKPISINNSTTSGKVNKEIIISWVSEL